MKILVTGAKGFVGKNLCATLYRSPSQRPAPSLPPPQGEGGSPSQTLPRREGGSPSQTLPRREGLVIEEVWEYDVDTDPAMLEVWCRECDFVFNLAGVNRPKDTAEFMDGNFGFASTLLDTLKRQGNRCPVMLSSSQQASLTGRFGNSEYGRSKKAGEELFLDYQKETGAKVLIYRFPNLFGKWCRPNYNSAVATFCNAFANDLPYTVNDPTVELELLYIDDLVDEMMAALQGREHHCEFNGLEVLPQADGRYCYVPVTHKATLGEIIALLKRFAEQPKTLMIPEIPSGSFAKKLYSTYLSYLPYEKTAFDLKMNVDERGSFTELVHTLNCGQVSINISKPGITKGQHWHNTKWEQFIVVKGHGLIQQRRVGSPLPRVSPLPASPSGGGVGPLPASPSGGGVGPLWNTADPALYVELEEKAKRMRNNPTDAEAAMWELLRGKNLYAKFRRQHIIGDYIVDFVCLDRQLIVEVDGGYHNDPEQQLLDRQRTNFLQSKGYSVLRFTNEEVIGNTDETLAIIRNALKALAPSLPPPQGEEKAPSPEGRVGEGLTLGEGLPPSPEGRVGEGLVLNWYVSGDHIQAVHMLPGYTHNIINLSDTEDLVTVMYCNEVFDPNKPDTFFEPVK